MTSAFIPSRHAAAPFGPGVSDALLIALLIPSALIMAVVVLGAGIYALLRGAVRHIATLQ